MLKFTKVFLFSNFIFLFIFFTFSPLISSVPVTPFSLSQAEIIAILKDPQLYQLLGTGQRILDIQSHEDGYLISATKSQVMVKVHYLPVEGVIGVADFKLEFSYL